MGKDAGKTVCWHGVQVVPDGKGGWIHAQSRTPCDDPAPYDTPPAK
jgi:hypothetical protein